jgi:hypothetical protein
MGSKSIRAKQVVSTVYLLLISPMRATRLFLLSFDQHNSIPLKNNKKSHSLCIYSAFPLFDCFLSTRSKYSIDHPLIKHCPEKPTPSFTPIQEKRRQRTEGVSLLVRRVWMPRRSCRVSREASVVEEN